MEKKEPIRVAHIMGKMLGGGVEAFVMNYYRNIDRTKVQFDFIIDNDSAYVPREEIESLGGRIIEVPPYQHIFQYIKVLTTVLKKNKYKIVHSNINSLSVFPLFCAAIAGVPVRIAHSHSTTNKKEWKKNIIKNILKPFSKLFANQYFCCTEHAGRWLFGNKFFDTGRVIIINNAIDVQRFNFDLNKRNIMREKLNVEDKIVIGHVGRFIPQKNHERIVEIFYKFHKINKNSVLLLIGDGKLKGNIEELVKSMNLEESVLFLGQRDDVNDIFQAMDIFLFPSLYEGLGMVLIEAQCSNLECVASTEVPKVVKINDNFKFISLDSSSDAWVKNILDSISNLNRHDCTQAISNAGYNIKVEARKLEERYLNM